MGPGGVFAPTQNAIAGPVAFGGGRFVAAWATGLVEPGAGAIHGAAFSPDGSMLLSPVVLDVGGADARMAGLAMVGDHAYLVFTRSGTMLVQRFDASLAAVGSPVEVPGLTYATLGVDVRTVGDAVAITGTTDANTTSFRVMIEGASRAFDVVFAGCAYQVTMGISTGSGSQSAFRAYEIDASDTIRSYTMDRLWVQSNQSFAAFQTNAGGLIRVLEDKQIALQS
ncbi:MAG: hypothetical protein JRH11_11600, partial [Deltaproteobacteria bacterium]|nr:hypothetical protein [Deltaproteobacteria bacterium]